MGKIQNQTRMYIRLVTCEQFGVKCTITHYKEWLGGIDQVVSRVTLNADIPCVHEAFYVH